MTNPQSAPIIMLADAAEGLGAACRKLLEAQHGLQAARSRQSEDIVVHLMQAGVVAKEWEVRYLSNKMGQLLVSFREEA